MKLKTWALIALYLAAIIAANQIITEYGKDAVLYVGAGLIGFNIVCRDRLHDLFAKRRLPKMAALILTGSLLSYWLNADAATIAKASAVAFAASEGIDAIVYQVLRRRVWFERSNISNVFSATVDTLIFFQIAFGSIPVELAFAQIMCKVGGGVVYTLLLQRREDSHAVLLGDA